MADFIVERLVVDRIPLAYPLIRQVAPGMDLRRWARFAKATASDREAANAGILVARRPQHSYPCGMVCYRRDNDPTHGAVLTAEYLVALDIVDPSGAVDALMARLEQVARDLGCGAVRALVLGASPAATEELLAAGHCRQGTMLMKVLGHDHGRTSAN